MNHNFYSHFAHHPFVMVAGKEEEEVFLQFLILFYDGRNFLWFLHAFEQIISSFFSRELMDLLCNYPRLFMWMGLDANHFLRRNIILILGFCYFLTRKKNPRFGMRKTSEYKNRACWKLKTVFVKLPVRHELALEFPRGS